MQATQTQIINTRSTPLAWGITLLAVALIACTSCTNFLPAVDQLFPFGLKTVADSTDPHAIRILFIGNSFTYVNNMPGIFSWMLRKQQPTRHFKVVSFTLPGCTLRQHLQRSEVTDLLKQSWDFIILQEQSGAAFDGQASVRSSFGAFLSHIPTVGPKTFMVMTWADRGQFANESIISQTYRRTGRELNIPIISVGDLFFYVQEIYPQIALYQSDNHHPEIAGAYLYALTVYNQLFGDSNLPSISGNDNKANGPSIKADTARELSSSIKEWLSISKTLPEFAEELPETNTDLERYWAMNGRAIEAEALSQKRLNAVNRLFPLQNNSASANAYKELADAQYMCNTSPKIAQSYENYSRAEQIYRKIEGPNSKQANDIVNFMQQIKTRENQ